MADYILSPNMLLTMPIPGVAPGPNYAFEQNVAFLTIDGHDHSPGKGVQIHPNGLNINSDLTFLANNATNLRSVRFTSQASPLALAADIGCLYESAVDLWFNDGNGNQIRLTQSGSIAGTTGSISGLVPPASASYSSGSSTFIFQSNINTPANIDGASFILRNLTVNSKGLTLSPPNAMAANYTITLPSLPAALSFVTIDTSGNMGTMTETSILQDLVPTGATIPFAGTGATPVNYLLANGAAVSRTTYSDLFTVIGTTYGPGDGTTTFNLPDATGLLAFKGAGTIPVYVQSYWKMNQASGGEPNFASSGSGFNLVQTGTVPSIAGHVAGINARGPYTTGTNYFTVPLASGFATPYDSQIFVAGFWMKTTLSGTFNNIMGKQNGSSQGWVIRVNASNFIELLINGTTPYSATSGNVADSAWHLVYVANMATSGANNLRIYVDNIEVFAGTGISYTPAAIDIGVGVNLSGPADAFLQGDLSLVQWWTSMPGSWAAFETIINGSWNGGAGSDYTANVPVNYIVKT